MKKLFLAMVTLLSACSPVGLLNATIPRDGYTVHKDLAYGSNPRQKLDVYVPQKLAKGSPVILFIYGGSWASGNKNDYLFVGQSFASMGYIAVVADYRLYPEVYFPAPMQDAAMALRWTHDHAGEYGGDVNHIFMAGHSAGGMNAVMPVVDDRYMQEAGAKRAWVRGVIGISGPYDFKATDPKVVAFLSKVPYEETQAVHYVVPGQHYPPMLLVNGDADNTVWPRNANNMAEKLQETGNPVTKIIYPGVGHIGTVLSLARGFRGKTSLYDDIQAFVTPLVATP